MHAHLEDCAAAAPAQMHGLRHRCPAIQTTLGIFYSVQSGRERA